MEEKIQIAPIKLSDVERMVASVKKNIGDNDADLSFEFILTAFFPTCWNNIEEALNKQYTLGYIAGYKDGEASYIDTINDGVDCYCE
jgi:hypothetical protein